MANFLSVGSVIEKNKLFSNKPFLNLIEIDVTDPHTCQFIETLYFVNNKENIEYQGHTYLATSFELEVKKTADEAPTLSLTFYDATRAVEAAIQEYKGATGFKVRVIFVNTGALDQPPEVSEEFEILYTSNSNYAINVTLGAENPLDKRCPRRYCYREVCSWLYKSEHCGYKGDLETCDYTLSGSNGCRAHNNTKNYGGFPGIPQS